MFKNRIRTAAIAGIAALATGLSGIAVPSIATAQTNSQDVAPGAPAGEYWEDNDASAAFDASPVNHSEDDLKLLTDETQNFIDNEADNTWNSLHTNLDFDASEEAIAERLRVIHEDILEAQQENSDAIKRVREAIAFAYQQDLEATEAWQAVVDRAYEINQEIVALDQAPRAASQADAGLGEINYVPKGGTEADAKPLDEFAAGEYYTIVELINYYADRDGFTGISDEDAADLEDLGENPSDIEVRDFYRALLNFTSTFHNVYNNTGEFMADGGTLEDGNRYSRHAVEAIVEFYDEIQGYKSDLDALIDTSARESREAQQSDVLVRQGFLQRALAQRDVLRNAEGSVLALARYAELYNDPTLTLDGTLLSTEYRRVQDRLAQSLEANLELLDGINENVLAAWDIWERDLYSNADATDIREGIEDDWNFALVEERLNLSTELYENLVANGVAWREALNRVIALENAVNAPSASDRIADALEELAGSEIGDEPGDGDNGNGDNGNDGNDGIAGGSSIDVDPSSEGGLGTIGILAGIAAVIGLIAAAVPFLGNFIPNLPF